MNLRRTLGVAILAAAPFASADNASAQCGYGNFGCAFDIGRLYRVLADNVPYYSAFPPVYYSYPVPRTYGYSPFAYLPTEKTPEISMDLAPVTIANPFFNEATESGDALVAAEVDQVANTTPVRPVTIENPYVVNVVSLGDGPVLQAAHREW